MQQAPKFAFDVASALAQGQRDQQEDAVITDFPQGGEFGFAVLADGMGGHAAGDVASKIVVTEVFSELKLQSGNTEAMENDMASILQNAVTVANEGVKHHTEINPAAEGMGATLVAPVILDDRLYWISVGDSPLFLYRDGKLKQLNEDHSLAGQIDMLVKKGLMAEETAENHPDRHCLTSVLIGDQIPRIDCPETPFTLQQGDILLVASDGLQFLEDVEIAGLVEESCNQGSAEIARTLLRALDALGDPHQDNVSVCVIKVCAAATACTTVEDVPAAVHVTHPAIPPDDAFAPLPPEVAATAEIDGPNKITIVARKTLDGLSMLYQFKRPSEKSA